MRPSQFIHQWQRDPRWRNTRLGEGTRTIGSDGCVITSLGMALGWEPTRVNNELMAQDAYMGSLFFFERCQDYLPLINVFRSQPWAYPVPNNDMAKLRAHLRSGNPAVILVDGTMVTTKLDTHYVLALPFSDGDERIIIHDPLYKDGAFNDITKRYGASPELAIWRYDLLAYPQE